jgi:RND superfamily putative drug exporter
MELFGDRAWWMPAWLDRLVPHLDVEGPSSDAPEPVRPATVPAR